MHRLIRILLRTAIALAVMCAATAHADNATELRARHSALRDRLANNQFEKPLYLESTEREGAVAGDVFAIVNQPYSVIGPALREVKHWCDILILPINVKGCLASSDKSNGKTATLAVTIGRKHDQPIKDAHTLEFDFEIQANQGDYQRMALTAAEGPLNTSNYRIVLEVGELDGKRSFLHLRYAYDSGVAARVAMRGYLATVGRDKIGFSVVGHKENGDPIYTRGMRGVIERNTMRYYLAIEAFLGTLGAPSSERTDRRLNDWFVNSERYAAQLHELEHDEYLTMKRQEIKRQRAQTPPIS
jgi:hypothetical protein